MSRTKIDLFLQCKRCAYLDLKLGTARPPGFPMSLNNAVDELMKKEFDIHRANKTVHPLAKAYGLKAVPYDHEKLEEWRDALKRGVRYHHEPTNFLVRGGIDDVWQDEDGKLIIVDYKATSKKEAVSLDAEWQISYKRQIEVYQWLFRMNGFEVSPVGYFVYVNGRTDAKAFDGKLEFDISLLPYEGDPSWIPGTLADLRILLETDAIPTAAADCDYCRYRETAGKTLLAEHKRGQTHAKKKL